MLSTFDAEGLSGLELLLSCQDPPLVSSFPRSVHFFLTTMPSGALPPTFLFFLLRCSRGLPGADAMSFFVFFEGSLLAPDGATHSGLLPSWALCPTALPLSSFGHAR